MKLVLPLPPNRANARGSFWKHHKGQKAYVMRLDNLQLIGAVPPPPKLPLPKARISATIYAWSLSDPDNATGRLKWVLDWLVSRGYIADDSPKVLDLEMPRQAIDRKDPRVEVFLQEVLGDA